MNSISITSVKYVIVVDGVAMWVAFGEAAGWLSTVKRSYGRYARIIRLENFNG